MRLIVVSGRGVMLRSYRGGERARCLSGNLRPWSTNPF